MEDINSKNAGLASEPASPSLKSLAGGYADPEENSGLVKFGRTAQKVCPRTRGAEKTNYPSPSRRRRLDVVENNRRGKKWGQLSHDLYDNKRLTYESHQNSLLFSIL